MQERLEGGKEGDGGLEGRRQLCQLVILDADGEKRASQGEEEVEARKGWADTMEGVDEGGKVVGRCFWADVPMQPGKH